MANIFRPPCDEGVILAGPEVEACPSQLAPWILAATILGSSMVFIDGTVVNVALPALQVDLHATVADFQWVVEAYALFLAALLLVGGSLGDRFGRRRIFAIGVVLFASASVGCGLAAQVGQLVVARAIQGIGGALLTPASLAIISASFSRQQRGRAIGTWSGLTAVTSAVGPVMGGWLVDHFSWRAVFFINLPLALAVLAITFWRVPESRDTAAAPRLDWAGAVCATLGLGALVFGLIQLGTLGRASLVGPVAVGAGLVILALFVVTEAKSRAPMLPLGLFRSRTFSGTNLLTLLLYAGLTGATFFLPFNLIQVQGYSAAAAGAAFLPFIAIMSLLSRWSGGLVTRYGAKPPLIIGPALAALGFALFAIPGIGGSYWATFFPAMLVLGLGMAVTVAPLTTTVMGSVDVRHAGLASGVNNAVARTAGLLAIAAMGVVLLVTFTAALHARLSLLQLPAQAGEALTRQETLLAAATVPPGVSAEAGAAIKRAINESFVMGFRLVALIAAGLAVASAVCAWLTITSPARGNEEAQAGSASKAPRQKGTTTPTLPSPRGGGS